MADKIEFTVEEDGTITTKTDEVSPVNHKSADDLLRFCRELAGGAVKETKLPHGHSHKHGQVKAER